MPDDGFYDPSFGCLAVLADQAGPPLHSVPHCVLLQIQAFMYGWLTFYHQGHEVAKDFKPYMTDLQIRVQNVSIASKK